MTRKWRGRSGRATPAVPASADESSSLACQICQCEPAIAKPFVNNPTCHGSHPVCESCALKWVVTQLESSPFKYLIRCPMCSCDYAPSTVVHLLSTILPTPLRDRHIANYERAERHAAIQQMIDFVPCPTPDCKGGGFLPADCRSSSDATCLVCNIPYRTSRATSDSRSTRYKAKLCKSCPMCQVTIDKDGGCIHMTCSQCRYEFCWQCLGAYGNIRAGNKRPRHPTGPCTPPEVRLRRRRHMLNGLVGTIIVFVLVWFLASLVFKCGEWVSGIPIPAPHRDRLLYPISSMLWVDTVYAAMVWCLWSLLRVPVWLWRGFVWLCSMTWTGLSATPFRVSSCVSAMHHMIWSFPTTMMAIANSITCTTPETIIDRLFTTAHIMATLVHYVMLPWQCGWSLVCWQCRIIWNTLSTIWWCICLITYIPYIGYVASGALWLCYGGLATVCTAYGIHLLAREMARSHKTHKPHHPALCFVPVIFSAAVLQCCPRWCDTMWTYMPNVMRIMLLEWVLCVGVRCGFVVLLYLHGLLRCVDVVSPIHLSWCRSWLDSEVWIRQSRQAWGETLYRVLSTTRVPKLRPRARIK